MNRFIVPVFRPFVWFQLNSTEVEGRNLKFLKFFTLENLVLLDGYEQRKEKTSPSNPIAIKVKNQQRKGSFQSTRKRSCVYSVTRCDWACSTIFLWWTQHQVLCFLPGRAEHFFFFFVLLAIILRETIGLLLEQSDLGAWICVLFYMTKYKTHYQWVNMEARQEIFHFLNGNLPCYRSNMHMSSWDILVGFRICGFRILLRMHWESFFFSDSMLVLFWGFLWSF